MSPKPICTRHVTHSWDLIAGDKSFPSRFADDHKNALSLITGSAKAKKPGEIANRLFRIVPTRPENVISWSGIAALKAMFSPSDLPKVVSLYLIDVDLHLMQIARFRARRDFVTVALECQAVGRIAGSLGALRLRTTAMLLEHACHVSDHAATYGLLSALSRASDAARTEMNDWLATDSVAFRA